MKEVVYTILLFFVLLVTGCTNELGINSKEEQISFSSIHASMSELPTSRIHLESENRMVWDLYDEVSVFSDMQATPVQFTCTSIDESKASFTGDDYVSGNNFYAFCPSWGKVVDGKLKFSFSNITEYREGGYFETQVPIVAKSSNNNFEFKQTCGFIRFSISGSQTIEELTLKSNDGTGITGTGYVDIYSDSPSFIIEDGGNSIKMSVNKKILPDEIAYFNFFIPVTKLENGITLEITGKTDDGRSFALSKSTSKCIDISRGVIKSFSVVNINELIEDYQANVYSKLMAFYNATGGNNWTNKTNWGSDKPFKEWYGITANDISISEINLSGNNLTGAISGELNGLSNLKSLNVQSNSLTSIKINSCPDLNIIMCENNQLSTLDVSENLCLAKIYANDNIIANLNLSSCPSLYSLQCYNNQLTELDLSDCYNVRDLDLMNNKLNNIDISQCSKLYSLTVMGNQLKKLSITGKENLHFLLCQGNLLEELTVSDCNALQQLVCNFNNLTSLDIKNCPNIEVLWCHQNKLTTLDVTSLTKLMNLYCGNFDSFEGNELTFLDLSKNTLLETFSCYGMKLNSLDVSKNTKLRVLECSGNPIQSLNVDNLTDLKELWCHTMKLSDNIDVSENANLEYLSCFDNPDLTKIYIKSSQQPFDYSKDETTKFCIKGSNDLYDDFPYYTSTDYSRDKTVTTLQSASIGNGINIVLMGDAFTDRLIDDKTYENIMKNAMEKFFAIEPYTSFRKYFNVYAVTAVSKNEIYANSSSTVFSCNIGGGGNNDKVFEYAKAAVPEDDIEDAVIIVLQNNQVHSGLCNLYPPSSGGNDYGKGANITYMSLQPSEELFEKIIQHEAGGHGFAKLGDEYSGWSDMTYIPSDLIEEIQTFSIYGWLKNLDIVNDPLTIKWNKFLKDVRYSNEDIGIFEGGYEYRYGVYHPSSHSKMNDLEGNFNAPSREAIYYRIHKLAYGEDWEYDYEKFVEYDAINCNTITARSTLGFKQMPPHNKPVIIKDSWKNVKNNIPSRSIAIQNHNEIKQKTSFNGNTPSMKSTIYHRVTLPDGSNMITIYDASGKTTIEYENK